MISMDEIEAVLERLGNVPARITRTTAGLTDAQLHQTGAPGEWSPAEILAHLRASDDIVAYRLYTIMARDNPPLAAYDERRWAQVTGYAQADFALSLQAFTLRRAELLNMLRQAAPGDWERSGTHEVRGPLSLFQVATVLAEHEEEHCLQLESRPG